MKIQTAFRIEESLLEMIKEKAKAQKRSLNNYIELLLFKDVGDIPNEETLEAINEARYSKELKPISGLDAFLNKI